MAEYRYYVTLYPGTTKERPAGIYRAPVDNRLYIESLRADGKWHFSPYRIKAVMEGDTLHDEEVSQETAERAIKNLLKSSR